MYQLDHPGGRRANQEASGQASTLLAARRDLYSIRNDLPCGDPRIERIEQALAAYEALAPARTIGADEKATTLTSGVNYLAEFEAALEARDEAGYLGTTPAETIRALAGELRSTACDVLPLDLSVRDINGHTELTFCDGKYTFVLAEDTDYLIEIRRYGQPWSTRIVGPGQIVFGRAIGSLAALLCDARSRLAKSDHRGLSDEGTRR